MGTRFQITLCAPGQAAAEGAARAAFAHIEKLNQIMSDYSPTSELMRLCDQAGKGAIGVSPELFAVLSQAQEISSMSHGAFDVTVGPIVKLWRRARRTQRIPPADELERARSLVGYKNVILDARKRTVTLLKPGMKLDLGGIAKGYAADQALAVLKDHGIDRALVAAGGDVAASGPPIDAKGWKIAIASLDSPASARTRFVWLEHAAVSTSGDAEQYVEIDGRRYSHIVDPRTGIGLVGRQSVTVVAPLGILADSLTKVASVLGPAEGLPIIEKIAGASALVVRQQAQGLEVSLSKNFPGFQVSKPPINGDGHDQEQSGRHHDRVPPS
jgi:thiamine biosynthesis lipoprotein